VTFSGFLPRRFAHRLRLFSALEEVPGMLVFFESPRRAAASLAEMAARWGNRRAVLAREITKVHEEFLRGSLRELAEKVGSGPLRGEVTPIVEGAPEEGGGPKGGGRLRLARAAGKGAVPLRELARLRREVNRRQGAGEGGRSAAVRAVARERGIDPRSLYRALARTAPGVDDTESEE
jgi:16S rRNA (cytidine1402-2'-O)-methyltransferase